MWGKVLTTQALPGALMEAKGRSIVMLLHTTLYNGRGLLLDIMSRLLVFPLRWDENWDANE